MKVFSHGDDQSLTIAFSMNLKLIELDEDPETSQHSASMLGLLN